MSSINAYSNVAADCQRYENNNFNDKGRNNPLDQEAGEDAEYFDAQNHPIDHEIKADGDGNWYQEGQVDHEIQSDGNGGFYQPGTGRGQPSNSEPGLGTINVGAGHRIDFDDAQALRSLRY